MGDGGMENYDELNRLRWHESQCLGNGVIANWPRTQQNSGCGMLVGVGVPHGRECSQIEQSQHHVVDLCFIRRQARAEGLEGTRLGGPQSFTPEGLHLRSRDEGKIGCVD
jgi:hypothetical protein